MTKIFHSAYRTVTGTLETFNSAVNNGQEAGGPKHWLYIAEITLVTTVVFFATLLAMAIFITDFEVLTDMRRLAFMLGCFTFLPLLFAKSAKQVLFRFSFAQLPYHKAAVFIGIKLLILIWLLFEYQAAVSHANHAETYHGLALHLKGVKLPLLMIAVYLVLSYAGLIISNLFAQREFSSSKSILRALIGANVLLLVAFPFDFGHFNSETHFSIEPLENGIKQQNYSVNTEKKLIAVVSNADGLMELMADAAGAESFLKLHYFVAKPKDPDWRQIAAFKNQSFDANAVAYEIGLEKMTNFCWLSLSDVTSPDLAREKAKVFRRSITNCIDDALILPPTVFFGRLMADDYYLKGFVSEHDLSTRNRLENVRFFLTEPSKDPSTIFIEPVGAKDSLDNIWHQENIIRRLDENRKTDIVKPYLANAANTGYFSHHFNVIAEGVREFENANFFISNQYGNGPIMITKIISIALGLNVYDSILVTPFLSFAIVLAVLLVQLRSTPHTYNATILASAFLGIVCTWWYSHFFAPFLYPVRYLPTILLVILLTTRVLREQSTPQRLSDDVLVVVFLPLIAAYNFEYAVPTVIAVFTAAVIGRRILMMVASVMGLLLTLFIKVFAPSTDKTESVDTFSYFDTTSFSGMDAQAVTYFGLMCIVTIIYLLKLRNSESFASDVVIFTALACSYKALGVGSVNHLGAGFLLLGCACCVIHKSINVRSTYEGLLAKSSLTAFNVGLLLCMVFVLSTWRFTLHHELQNEKYVETKFSTLQPISVGLAEKASDFETLLDDNSLVISPSDVVLALWHEQTLTTPFNELGTTILKPKLFKKIAAEYEMGNRIIVDRLISDEIYFNELMGLLQHPIYASALIDKRYWNIIDEMKSLYQKIIDTGRFKPCGTSKHFEAYCKT